MVHGGLSQEQVKTLMADVQGSDLIDESTKALLKFAEKVTRNPYKAVPEDISLLRESGLSDETILEGIQVISFFNYLDRMADATGAKVENLMEKMAMSVRP